VDRTTGVTIPPRPLLVASTVAAVLVAAGVIVGLLADDARPAVVGVALGGVVAGFGLVATGRGTDHEQQHERRAVGGPRLGRRATIAAAASVTVAVGIASVPAARRLDSATRRLRSTRWAAGTPLVDASGTRVALRSGIVVYSKLCTHMACPLGLYEQQSGTLLCPCHQALFDVLDGGRVRSPARRGGRCRAPARDRRRRPPDRPRRLLRRGRHRLLGAPVTT
jgi:nitrite reductase/ring-hydroxylating ferredoxin subunit